MSSNNYGDSIAAQPPTAFLILQSPDDINLPKKVPITKDTLVIGRLSSTDLCISNPRVPNMISRKHCSVVREAVAANANGTIDYKYKIVDLSSVNGTFLNRVKVQSAPLKSGDLIMFAKGGDKAIGDKINDLSHAVIYQFFERGQCSDSQESFRPSSSADSQASLLDGGFESESINNQQQSTVKRKHEDGQSQAAESTQNSASSQIDKKKSRVDEYEFQERVAARLAEEARREKERQEQLEAEKQRLREEAELERQRLQQEAEQERRRMLEEAENEKRRIIEEEMKKLEADMEQKKKEVMEAIERERALFQQQVEGISNQKQHQDAERERQTFQSQLEELQRKIDEEKKQSASAIKQLAELKKRAIAATEFEEEFTCVICQELILDASMLSCSHTFCKTCIAKWLAEKKKCPVCRKKYDGRVMKNLTMANIIEKLVSRLTPEERKAREQRIQDENAAEQQQVQKLEAIVADARKKGMKFLAVCDTWTEDEKRVFQNGVSRYNGKARELYCQLIGVDRDWIKRAPVHSLIKACVNMGIELTEKRPNLVDADEIRDKLYEFITL